MENNNQTQNPLEVWMRGPIVDIPDLLQPVAHTLLQLQEEVHTALNNFKEAFLWEKPSDVASVGFHVLHIAGVIDRMFTYAADKPLSEKQFEYLKAEKEIHQDLTIPSLLQILGNTISEAIQNLKNIDVSELTHVRYLGRKRIPTTQIGLIFHSAEHSMRHLGQLLVTIKILTNTR